MTFHEDVEPILQRHCQGCHRPGEIAPMPLLTYDQARPWAKAIRAAVLQKTHAALVRRSRAREFANDRTLSQSRDRHAGGLGGERCPRGRSEGCARAAAVQRRLDDRRARRHRRDAGGVQVPATGTIPYQYIVFPTGFTEDKWVRTSRGPSGEPRGGPPHDRVGVGAQPGDSGPPGQFFDLEASPNRPGADKKRMFSAGGDDSEVLQVFVPGGNAPALESGQARLIKAGSDILMQLHYTTIGTPATDRTRIGFVFAKEPPVERVRSVLVFNTDFTIPAGSPNAVVTAAAEVRSDLELVSLLPHMHLRGKSFAYRATYPDGRTEVLLSVPEYDFNWQMTYYLEEPKLLPKGTILECVGHYDNSRAIRSTPIPSRTSTTAIRPGRRC